MEFDNTAPCFMDDLLDFSSDIGEQEDDDETHNNPHLSTFSLYPEFVKEELEWISNKDAFPMVESLVDIMPNHLSFATSMSNSSTNSLNNHNHSHHHQSPISVLENSGSSFSSLGSRSIGNSNNNTNNGSGNMMFINLPSNFKVPGKARSKHGRKRRRDLLGQQFVCWSVQQKPSKKRASYSSKSSSTIGRRCLHCGSEKTPQWRAGPLGPKTLCNACGVRYKSGRLCDEYRPASSPTFSSELHSNSHRKIIEMRKQKVMPGSSGLKPAEIG